ncbi:MAG: autotransporter domain-containing protein [Endomicrobiaceae bacterium]|nr:autotransporter domain-containing protein [Endomicrobiaceae bacterium]
MHKIFNKLVTISFGVVFMTLLSIQAGFTAISGSITSNDYTYTSDATADVILTSTITSTGYTGVILSTSSATSLTVEGTDTAPSGWNNNESLNLSILGSSITINNISLTNNASLQASSLNVDSTSSLFSGTGSLNFQTITNNGYIDTVATDITATSGIQNNGNLAFEGGTNNNDITDTGELNIAFGNTVQNDSSATISQSTITISGVFHNNNSTADAVTASNGFFVNASATLQSNASALAGNITNNGGWVVFTGGTNDNDVTGTGWLRATNTMTNNGDISQGRVYIDGGTVTNNGEITADNIYIDSDAVLLTTNILDTTGSTGGIHNNGLLQVNVSSTGTVNNANIIDGTGNFEILDNTIFTQQTDKTITQNSITISTNASLTANADDLIVSDKIYNDGSLTLTGFSNINDNEITGTGDLFINDLIQNRKNINQENLTIYDAMSLFNIEGATITLTDNLLIGSLAGLQNDGVLNVVNGVNNGSIVYGTTSEGIINISGNFINNGNMGQEELHISSSGSVTSNASNSNIHQGISNDGALIFTGGTSDDNITGTGTLTFNGTEGGLTNTADINQFTVNITSGTFNNISVSLITATNIDIASGATLSTDIDDIDTYTNGGSINNAGLLQINADGTNLNGIQGSGNLEIASGYDVTNSSSIVQNIFSNSGNFTNDTNGTVEVSSFTNHGTVSNQNIIDATYLANRPSATIINDGIININGGINEGTIDRAGGVGFGTMTVTAGTFYNTGYIEQYSLIIKDGGHLVTNAGVLLLDTGYITNDSLLTLTGGTIGQNIYGSGTLAIEGDVSNNNFIQQSALNVVSGISSDFNILTNSSSTVVNDVFVGQYAGINNSNELNIGSLTNEGNIVNTSTSNFIVGNGLNTGSISGAGNIDISGGFDNNGGVLAQTNINITTTSASLISNATNLSGNINNIGTLTLTGGTNSNIITAYNGTFGNLIIDSSTVTNTAAIEQENVTVTSSGIFANQEDIIVRSLLTNSGTITNNSLITADSLTNNLNATITNDGTLTLNNGGSNQGVINGSAGVLNTYGNFTNNGDINQSSVTIHTGTFNNILGSSITAAYLGMASGTTMTTDIDDISATIGNDGLLQINADGTNNNNIMGGGRLEILESNNVMNSAIVTQDTIDIKGSLVNENFITATNGFTVAETGAMTTNASDISGDIENSGDLNFEGGTNNNTVTGNGVLNTTGTFTNNAAITQNTVNVASGSFTNNSGQLITSNNLNIDSNATMTTDIDDVKAGIDNDGTLTINAEGTNTNNITGTGTLAIATGSYDYVYNDTNTIISQNRILLTTSALVNNNQNENSIIATNGFYVDSNSYLKANASSLSGAIDNYGELAFTGGTNDNVVTGTGVIYIDNDIVNNVSVTQDDMQISTGNSLTTDASNLTIANGILNSGILSLTDATDTTLEESISGPGSLEKTGAGTVNLTGINTYSGTTTISDGALQIEAANNIGDNEILFDGGKLIASTNTAITLNNRFVGTEGNDVELDVLSGELELSTTSVITQASTVSTNLVKGGAGTLTLLMDSNYYQGDTYVSSGTLAGTTSNINGTLYGTGSSNFDTFEFTDVQSSTIAPHVVLNEVDNTNYLGTFNKTGSALMDVTKYFQAYQANISSGSLYINNVASGTDFIVNTTMTFTNSLLGGNSNITATGVVIGNGATLAPGNSIGTTNITGDETFLSGSTYEVEFEQTSMQNGGGNTDTTNVSGTVTIDNTNTSLDLINLNGKFFVHEIFDIITAGTLTGEFTTPGLTGYDVDTADLRLGSRIEYNVYNDVNVMKLEVSRIASDYENSPELTDMSNNEKEVAAAIDAISTGNGGDITNALDSLEKFYYYTSTYDLDALKAGFNDIAGVIYANSSLMSFFNAKTEHVYDRIQERCEDLYPCNKFHDKLWTEYYYNNYQVDENSNSPKYTTDVNGFLVGFDMISAKSWTIGAMAGYGTSTLKQEQDQTTMKDINLGFYGGYENTKWQLKGMLFGGYENYNTDREITFMDRTATSEHNGYSASLDLEAAYKISLTKDSQAKHKVLLKPFVGIVTSYIMQDSFKEKGAQDLNLNVKSNDTMISQAKVGVGVNGKIKKFGWYANIGARQILTDDYAESDISLVAFPGKTDMKIKGAELTPFSLSGGLGADYILSEDWTVFANGQTNYANTSKEYYANIGLTYKFGCINNKETVEKNQEYENQLIEKMQNELDEAAKREQALQDRIKQYEATVVNEQTAQELREKKITEIVLVNKPQFKFNSIELTESGKASLQQVVEELKQYPNAELLIEGHSDNMGTPEYNQILSEKRANIIAVVLKKDYDVKNYISIIGKGSHDNLVPNDTASHRAQNRRVEIIITASQETTVQK